ncbi:MAG: hypothetical protein JOZ37_19795, partial [Actinobacteria bacterium]|nr:hypothetical protein [Actinomycetota bacterium]
MPELFTEDHLEELRTLADSVRSVIDATVKTGVDYDVMARVSASLRGVAADLASV